MGTALRRIGGRIAGRIRRIAGRINRATERWRWPAAYGWTAAATLWVIWYFSKPACTMEGAAQGLCNPGVVAQYINYQIAAQCMLVGMAAATLKGGYDEIMLNRERKRADEAEERLAEERRKNDERDARRNAREERRDARIDELYAELMEERRQDRAARQESQAAQQQMAAAQQETLNRMAETQALIVQMLQRRQNGNGRAASDD